MLDADYVAGPVVPQQLWQPLYKRIREVLVENSRLCMPIFFIVQETGRVGLSLSDALAKKHYLLHGHNQAVDLGGKVTTHIRILAWTVSSTVISRTELIRSGKAMSSTSDRSRSKTKRAIATPSLSVV